MQGLSLIHICGELTAVDSVDGKIVRIRPHRKDDKYTPEELADSMWEIEVDGHTLRPQMLSLIHI